ncbi:MAG: sugar ABC transporter permease [Dehalococcoidales bacterium]|nr:sugar ABC transporter permease [Dehalococcoidales bacterium]
MDRSRISGTSQAGGLAVSGPPERPRGGGPLSGIWKELRRSETQAGWLFMAPALLIFLGFVGFPTVYGFWVSLHDWNLMTPDMTFIGARNYTELMGDPRFLESLYNTTYFTVGIVACIIVLSFLMAQLLNQKVRGITFFRGAVYSPAVTSVIAIGAVWFWVLDPEYGLINQVLLGLGVEGPRWLGDANWAMPGLILTAAWRNIGYFAVIYLAGLQGIDQMYYEAASIDGANWWGRFRHITVPLLMPTTFFVVVMTIILSFQVFPLIYVMTGGGPGGATSVIVFYLYQQAFIYFRMGYASAIGYVLFAIIFALTLVQFRFLGKHAEV